MTRRIGIDLGGTKTEGIVLDRGGEVLHRERRPTPAAAGYRAIVTAIAELVADLERIARQRCPVGIGTPGALSQSDGTLKNSNTVCMNGKPLLEDLEAALRREIRIENDANCFALAEAIDGAGKDHPVVFGVIMGTGVGGGIVCNKRLHAGPQHIAGEWGHNVLDPGGPACYCGRRGCVETYLSGPGLAGLWRSAGGDTMLSSVEIVARANAGDPLAGTVMEQYCERFGQALAMVINILDPDAVVLGGGMSNVPQLYRRGRDRVADYVFNSELRTPILANRHGDSAGVRGAAQLWPADAE